MDIVQERLNNLEKRIIELKGILNEIVIATDAEEIKIYISQYLDNLIVKYMTIMVNNKID
ncbi:hypothetical protein SDC9_101422 [bioreactor metagenome]|uniref:Spo0E like sporulation regulatory protein n=1 Tax=bioreactor metagenome TaxID=1076179 RepID=A0A645AUQ3_9ZZZZ